MTAAAPAPLLPTAPRLPIWLGLAGLIPFWVLAIALVTGRPQTWSVPLLEAVLATYAATIVSFLGGIRWGLAVARDPGDQRLSLYVGSVLPQLIAWGALALPDPWRFAGLGFLVLVLGPMDRGLVARGLAPAWFGRLRLLLSLGAGAALFLAALA